MLTNLIITLFLALIMVLVITPIFYVIWGKVGDFLRAGENNNKVIINKLRHSPHCTIKKIIINGQNNSACPDDGATNTNK